MVLNRLCDPASKLGTVDWITTVYHPRWDGLEIDHLYTSLHFLADHKDRIEHESYSRSASPVQPGGRLVLPNTTYFRGRSANGLARFGFSKDNRPDRVQVMVGVLMSRDGFPIVREGFPGDTAELETFRETLRALRERFKIGRMIPVADRGMVSETVLCEVEQVGLNGANG